MKKALITGITGQDGSYLSELLLDKGYEVHGIIRRSSSFNTKRIDHIYDHLRLYYGDVTDTLSIQNIINEIKPDEIYNLAAQSHVAVSFELPEYTGQVDALGVLKLLESVKKYSPKTKIYQASTSELFGKVKEIPQKETTQFHPRSPYGVSKIYAYWICKNYRESYNMFISNGILFNHESILKNSPIIIKSDNMIDILPIEDLFRTEKHKYEGILDKYKNKLVWNGDNWTKIINGTCYKEINKEVKLVQTVDSCYESTGDHIVFKEDNSEIETRNLKKSDKLYKISYPENINILKIDKNLAYFIGFVIGDGYISEDGSIRLTGTDKNEIERVANLLTTMYGWKYSINTYGVGQYDNCKNYIWQLDILNDKNFGKWLRDNIYTKRSKEKRIPDFILNSDIETKKSFFDGYYLADGRKKGNEKYDYKGYTTSSATLSLGLIYILRSFSNQVPKCKCDYRDLKRYYYVQLRSDGTSGRGSHLMKNLNEVINIKNTISEDGWFFDIQTESQTFATGPNLVKIHNSPRRGETFVTRKITIGLSNWLKTNKPIKLGNLNSRRDWGYAKDYIYGMWLMLQHDEPDDFILATGESHSIREFVEECCKYIGINIEWVGDGINEKGIEKNSGEVIIEIDPKYFRPSEVDLLLGDPSKSKRILNWEPKVKFKELVKIMMEHDLNKNKNI